MNRQILPSWQLKSRQGYKQVIIYPPLLDTVYALTEEYDRVYKAIPSSFDSAWKLSKFYIIKTMGGITIPNVIGFKRYFRGYFIWGVDAGQRFLKNYRLIWLR